MSKTKSPKWRIKFEHLMACNCDWGCPCSFNSAPTTGQCESALGWRIVEGRYGNVDLAGLKWILAVSWPGAIHEGRGRGVVFVDARAKGEKREALEGIATGRAGGPIGVLMSTLTEVDVREATIGWRFSGKSSRFSAGDAVEVVFESMTNPATGAPFDATVLLPQGMLNREERYYSAKVQSVDADGVTFEHPGKNAFTSENTWKGP